jgi:hypothetical protein
MVGRIFCAALVGLWLAGCGGGASNNGGDTDGGSDAVVTDLGDASGGHRARRGRRGRRRLGG